MNFENKLSLTSKKYWYSRTDEKLYHESISNLYNLEVKYAIRYRAELNYYRAIAARMNLSEKIIQDIDARIETTLYCADYDIMIISKGENFDRLISYYEEYMTEGYLKVDLEYIQNEQTRYNHIRNLDLVEIDESQFKQFYVDLVSKRIAAEVTIKRDKYILEESAADNLKIKKNENDNANEVVNYSFNFVLNSLLLFVGSILLITVIHINTVPLSQNIVSLAIEDKYEPLNMAARDYIVKNNITRLKATLYLCLLTSNEFEERLFDQSDRVACDYFETGKGIREWLKLDRDR